MIKDQERSVPLKKRKIEEIQVARTLAILAVLLVHSSSTGVATVPHDSFFYPFYNFFNIAGKLGTPTFILLSSFVLFYTYFDRDMTRKLIGGFYLKRLKYILLPYFLFSGLYFGLKWYIHYDYPNLGFALQKFAGQLAMGDAHPHLYFVFISVQFYLLFPLFLWLFKKSRFTRTHALWIGLAIQWIWIYLNKNYFGITMKGSISLSYMSFYFIGAYLGIHYETIRIKMTSSDFRARTVSWLFMGYGMMLVFYTGFMYLSRTGVYETIRDRLPLFVIRNIDEFAWATHALFAALVIVYMAHVLWKKASESVRKVFIEVGSTSFGIYLIHPLYLMVFRQINPSGEPLLFHLWQGATFVTVGLLSWATVRLAYRYIPHAWVFFGNDSKQPKQTQQKGVH